MKGHCRLRACPPKSHVPGQQIDRGVKPVGRGLVLDVQDIGMELTRHTPHRAPASPIPVIHHWQYRQAARELVLGISSHPGLPRSQNHHVGPLSGHGVSKLMRVIAHPSLHWRVFTCDETDVHKQFSPSLSLIAKHSHA